MKRFLALLLSVAMLCGLLPAMAEETSTPTDLTGSADAFTVERTSTWDILGADVTTYVHTKTGAKVVLVANEDNNRYFSINFRTPAENDRGTPHVFEHATLDGSKKYPYPELFFNLSSQSYNTNMNASTYAYGFTMFHHTSLSEEQLLATTDFYVDSVFHPMVLEDESLFREEAWRYSLDSLDADLKIEGTVYSEMGNSYSINHAHMQNVSRSVTPCSLVGNSTGGNPDFIPELTWQELKDYHAKYYHPSNSITLLYGNFEHPEAFLSLLDGYFSEFEPKEFTFDYADYTPVTASADYAFQFAVSADTQADGASLITLSWPLGDISDEDFNTLDLLTTVLDNDASPLGEAVREKMPYASVGAYVNNILPERMFQVEATNVNPEDVPVLQELIRGVLEEVAAKPFSDGLIDAVSHEARLSALLASDSATIGEDYMPNVAYYMFVTEKPYAFEEMLYTEEAFTAKNNDGSFRNSVARLLADDAVCVTVVTSPEVGAKEAKDAALAEQLAQTKAAMTPEELQAIVDETAGRSQAVSDPEALQAAIRSLQVVTVENLPEEIRQYPLKDETDADGTRHIWAEAEVEGLGISYMLLDASTIPQEYLHWYRLFVQLMGRVDTTTMNRTEQAQAMSRYLYNYSSNTAYYDTDPDSEEGQPFFRVSFTALDEDLPTAYDLLYDMVFNIDLTKTDQILDYVSGAKTSLRTSLESDPLYLGYYGRVSSFSPSMAYVNYTQRLPYYQFLVETEELLQSSPETVIQNLEYVRNCLANRNGAVVGYAGSAAGNDANNAAVAGFIGKLESKDLPRQQYSFAVAAPTHATIVDNGMNFNFMAASYKTLGLEEFTGDLSVICNMLTDAYMLPQLRDQYGAYGAWASALDDGLMLYTYADPNVAKSYEVFAGLPDFLESFTIDQATLDGYILSSYSGYAMTTGELSGAYNAMTNLVSNVTYEDTLKYMAQIKGVTAETVQSYAPYFRKLAEEGVIYTVGNAASINGAADLFEETDNPFGAVDRTQVTLSDIDEEAWYAPAVHFAYENGYMNAASEDAFGVDAPATAGELFAEFYTIVGGSYDPAAAIEFWSQHGACDASLDPATELTREDYVLYVWQFLALAVGELPVEGEPLAEYTDADQVTAGLEEGWNLAVSYEFLHTEENLLNPAGAATRADIAQFVYVMMAE